MKIAQIYEGLSPVLYHYTSLRKAGLIADANAFKLASRFKNSSELGTGTKQKLFFLSTSRSPAAGYSSSKANYDAMSHAIFVLDGSKLQNKYAGEPVSYYSHRARRSNTLNDEQEDRVYSNDLYIENASNYINEVHILLSKKNNADNAKAIRILKQQSYPVYIYSDKTAFLQLNKNKTVDLSATEFTKEKARKEWPPYDSDASKKSIARHTGRRQPEIQYGIGMLLLLMQIPVTQVKKLRYNQKDFITSLVAVHDNADLNHATGRVDSLLYDSNEPGIKPTALKIAKLMKRYRLKNPTDVTTFLVNKWRPVVGSNN